MRKFDLDLKTVNIANKNKKKNKINNKFERNAQFLKNKNNIENNKLKKNITISGDNFRRKYTYFKPIINKIKKKDRYFK